MNQSEKAALSSSDSRNSQYKNYGLINYGRTCYFNVSLQVLSKIIRFFKDIFQQDSSKVTKIFLELSVLMRFNANKTRKLELQQ